METYEDIFNLKKTVMPISNVLLKSVLNESIFSGYTQCSYNKMIETIREITSSSEYECSINSDYIYKLCNDPTNKCDVMIEIEGIRDYSEYILKSIKKESIGWSSFITYSEGFKNELYKLKEVVIKKILWNPLNISNWIDDNNISFISSTKKTLESDFESFKEKVLLTKDLGGFVESCEQSNKDKAIRILMKNLRNMLNKYKTELIYHIENNTKKEEKIKIKNPIVKKIYINSKYEAQAKKEWAKLNVISLDKRSFDSLSVWKD